jgi:hypothetical protein
LIFSRALVHIELKHIEAAIEDLTTAISLILGPFTRRRNFH